jgi:hypothetical protein
MFTHCAQFEMAVMSRNALGTEPRIFLASANIELLMIKLETAFRSRAHSAITLGVIGRGERGS